MSNKPTNLEFYESLMPVLTQADWQYNDTAGFGNVQFWLDANQGVFEGFAVKLRVGIINGGSWLKMFVRVDTMEYPRQAFTQDLAANPEKTSIEELRIEAEAVAALLLQHHAIEIRQAQQEWQQKIEQMRPKPE